MSKPIKQKVWVLRVPENASGLIIQDLNIGSSKITEYHLTLQELDNEYASTEY